VKNIITISIILLDRDEIVINVVNRCFAKYHARRM